MQVRLISLQNRHNRFKQIVKEFGDIWNVIAGPMPLVCLRDHGYQIRSLNGMHIRNVLVSDVEVL